MRYTPIAHYFNHAGAGKADEAQVATGLDQLAGGEMLPRPGLAAISGTIVENRELAVVVRRVD